MLEKIIQDQTKSRRSGWVMVALVIIGVVVWLLLSGCASNQPQLTVVGPATMDSMSTVRVTGPDGHDSTTEVVGRAVRSPAQADFELQMAKVRLMIVELEYKKARAIAQGRVYGAYTGQYYGPGIYGSVYYDSQPMFGQVFDDGRRTGCVTAYGRHPPPGCKP